MADLDHPHIVSVFGTGCERGVQYYAMQLIEGQTLADVIASRRLSTASSTEPGDEAEKETAPLAKLSTARTGGEAEWFFVPVQAGTFALTCTIPGHADAGMVGEMTVK